MEGLHPTSRRPITLRSAGQLLINEMTAHGEGSLREDRADPASLTFSP